MFFEKKVKIYQKKDRETWLQLKKALKEEGVKGVTAWHYYMDSIVNCGCGGAKLDPRDFGENGIIDHDVYYIKVKESRVEEAQAAIKKHGLVAVVDEDAALDAKDRYEKMGAFNR